jgi:radical SAM superfamily enzyme YgiQ (UPF0313 family)
MLLVRAGHATLTHYNITYPMGLLYLAAAVRRELGAEVRIVDGRFPWNGRNRILEELRRFRPEIVGISALTQDAPAMHTIARWVRETASEVFVIAGGAHPTIFPARTIADENIDAVVVGEGERALVAVARELAAGRSLDGIPGVRTRGAGILPGDSGAPTEHAEIVAQLDELPLPAWDLIDARPYALWPSMAPVGVRRHRSLVTSRGCPFGCIYCHRNHGKIFRPHSAERVLEEIALLTRQGVTDFEVVDDVFNLDRHRVEAIFEGVLGAGQRIHFQFPNGLRSDLLDDQTLATMRRGGTNWISFAIETASERLQAVIGKRLRLERARRAIEVAEGLGVFCDGFFMLGLPTETEEEAEQTIRFACDSPLHSAKFFLAVPFPETEMYERYARREGSAYERYDYFYTTQNVSQIPDAHLSLLAEEGLRRFYRDPRRMRRILGAHPSPLSLPFFGGVVAWRSLLARLRGR